MFDLTRLTQWGLAFFLLVLTLVVEPSTLRAQNTPVYIDDSPAAVDQLTEAIRLRSQNRLTEAATKYQHILETYRHKLMQTDKPYYTDTRRLVVLRLLADKPLLQTYRSQYEASAKRLLTEAATVPHRLAALLGVVDRYYLCQSGMTAGLDAVGLLLEQADIPAASAMLEQLSDHPDRQAMAQRYDALQAACHVLDNPAPIGSDNVLLKPLQMQSVPMRPPVKSPLSQIGQAGWAIPGMTAPPTQLWSIKLDNPFTGDQATTHRRRVYRRTKQNGSKSPLDGNLIPLIHGDMLLVNAQQGINAYDRLSGRQLWQYDMLDGATGNTNVRNSAPLDPQRSVCVAENRVIGVVGFMTQWRATWRLKNHQTHLVCLDMKTGTLLWDKQPQDLDKSLNEVFFHGTPQADDRRVYVLMRRSQNSGFHTVYLAALDITDGHLLWKRHLASAAMGSNRYFALGEMTLYKGQVYVTDNLGTVSAVDGLTGDMLWLYMLDRSSDSLDIAPKPLVARPIRRKVAASRPAPIVTSSNVLVAPAWANEPAQVLDRLTGNPIRKLDDPGFDVNCQLALTPAGLLSIGKQVALYDIDTFKKIWKKKVKGLTDRKKAQFLVHGNQVLIQADTNLVTLNLKDGLVENETAFDQDGVILTAKDQWIISQGSQLVSLMRWEDAYNQLVARIDRYPNQAWPGLALSHIAARRQQWSTVLQGIDAAINAINIFPAVPINSSQQQQVQQIFDHIRELVELPAQGVKDPQLAEAKLHDTPDHTTMMALFERMAVVSMTPVNEVTQQFARGRYWQYRGQPAMAIEHYQSVLADPTLAAQLYQFKQGARQARLEARLRLIQIVTAEPQTMTQFEAVAAEHLKQLQQMSTTTADSYLAMAESYPLTQASAQARRAAAAQLWQQGLIRQAVTQLQQAYNLANRMALKQQLAGRLAQGYQRLGKTDRAHRVLNNFAMLFPNEPVLRDDKLVSVDAWISELSHWHPLQTRYPEYHLPLGKANGLNGRLLLPSHHRPNVHTRNMVLLRNDTLCLYRLDQQKIIWSLPLDDAQTQLLAQSEDQLLLWQPTLGRLVCLNIRTGQSMWDPINLPDQVQSVAKQPNRLAMEPDVQRQWMQMMNPNGLMVVNGRIREARAEVDPSLRVAVATNTLVAADGTGRVLAIDRTTGITLWKRLYALDMLEHMAIHDQFLAIGGSVGLPHDTQSHRMIVVDLLTGEPVMHPMEGKNPLKWLEIINPDLLISLTDDVVTAHRIGTGEVVWRLPNPGTPMLPNETPSVSGSGSNVSISGINPLPHVMLFRDNRGTYTSIDLSTGQTTGTWPANGSENTTQPQILLTDERYYLLTPTQLTSTDMSGNLVWHDAINTTTQYLLSMQLGDDYLVLLTRRDQGWGNPDSPDAMMDQPIHDPDAQQMRGALPDRQINRIEPTAPFSDIADGQYRYQILLLDRVTGRIVNEQALSPMPSPILPTMTHLCDRNLILSTTSQTIIIPAGKPSDEVDDSQ